MKKFTPKLEDRIDIIQDAINSLIKVHTDMRDSIVASDRKNLRMNAVYFLMGRLLTHCNSMLKLMQEGFWVEATIIIRSMYETQWLLEYFGIEENESKIHLKNWFDGKIIKPSMVRKKVSFDDESLLSFHRVVYKELSQFIHPTYRSSTFNMNGKNFEYIYSGASGHDKDWQFVTDYAAQTIMAFMLEFLLEDNYEVFTLDRKSRMDLKKNCERLIEEFTKGWPPQERKKFLGFPNTLDEIHV